MSDALTALLAGATAVGAPPKLILDAAAYAQRVLLQNREVPWHDATAYANHLGQAQALLKPAVALVALDRMLRSEIDTNAQLREAMAARSRTGFAAKTLLGDEETRGRAQQLVSTAVKTQREPVVLHLPSPLELLTLTAQAVDTDAECDFDDDDAENTAVYYADWLRAFAECGVAGILFDEREAQSSLESYQPIMNTAQHYRWPIGLRSTTEVRFFEPEAVIPVLEFQALDAPLDVAGSGVLLMEIPADAVPEYVLGRLEALRTAR